MKQYICTKVIYAVPVKMVNGCPWPEGLPLPEVEQRCEQEDCCCHDNLELDIRDGYMFTTSRDDRYPQYMNAEEFEQMCRSTDRLSFGDALEAAKQGKKIARHGWNGKSQYVELATSISYVNADNGIVNVLHSNIGSKALAFVGTSGVQLGWLASQADMLADDWYIVE